MVEKVASKLQPSTLNCLTTKLKTQERQPDKQPSNRLHIIGENDRDVTEEKCDVTLTCCDVIKSQLVTEVFEYLMANNPSVRWRTEREKGLLEAGLKALSKEQREILEREREIFKLDNNSDSNV